MERSMLLLDRCRSLPDGVTGVGLLAFGIATGRHHPEQYGEKEHPGDEVGDLGGSQHGTLRGPCGRWDSGRSVELDQVLRGDAASLRVDEVEPLRRATTRRELLERVGVVRFRTPVDSGRDAVEGHAGRGVPVA